MAAAKLRATLLQVVASLAGGVLLARLLYATEPGRALLQLVPQRLWTGLFDALGVQGAEATSGAEALLVLLASIVVAAAVVRGVALRLRRRGAR